jgi:hypothetical protein
MKKSSSIKISVKNENIDLGEKIGIVLFVEGNDDFAESHNLITYPSNVKLNMQTIFQIALDDSIVLPEGYKKDKFKTAEELNTHLALL